MSFDPKAVDPQHPVFGTVCYCEGKKLKYQSLCMDCCLALPGHLKSELWRPFSMGFAQHYRNAVAWLGEHTQCLTNSSPIK